MNERTPGNPSPQGPDNDPSENSRPQQTGFGKQPAQPAGPAQPSQSQGWNRPRASVEPGAGAQVGGEGASTYSSHSPYSQFSRNTETGQQQHTGASQTHSFAAQPAGTQGAYQASGAYQAPPSAQTGQSMAPPQDPYPAQGEPAKQKRSVGLGTALAMMLVGSIAAGSITGAVVGGNNDSSTTSVNEALNRPVADNAAPAAQGSIEEVSTKVLPAVVSIMVASQRSQAEGSGSVISPDGYVLTNHHVVSGGENGSIVVTMNDGSKHEADLVASDVNTDVAVIKIKDVQNLPYLEFGDSDSLRVGQEVVAVGSPLGLTATVTSGIVSALNRPVRASQGGGESSLIDAIQTDAAVNPGNSGGPLVDMNGNLVGMNSMIASLSSGPGGEAGSIGLGFAIPAKFAKRMADQLINQGEVKHPMLGVQVDGRDREAGALIVSVEPDSPAERAGLKAGDLVTKLNDRLIENSDSLIAATRSLEFGDTATLEVRSEGSEDARTVEVTVSGE